MTGATDTARLRLFVICAHRLNFRRAGEETGIKPATVSERIRALEDEVGARLFNRTTRSVSLTQAGADLLAQVEPALAQIEEALVGARQASSTPSGRLRINGPRPALEFRLTPLLIGFMAMHPRISVELVGEDGFVDVVEGGFDAGVRFDEDLHRDMIAVRLGSPHRFRVVASPQYLAGAEPIRTPGDLTRHRCIAQLFPSGVRLSWEFERAGRRIVVKPEGPFTTTEPRAQLDAAIAGVGIAYLFAEHCQEAISDGLLLPILDDWLASFPAASLYFPERRLMQPALRALVDYIKANVSKL